MGKRVTPSDQDRAAATDQAARELLAAGNTPAARHAARHELDRALKALHAADPPRAQLIDAHITGVLAAIAAALPRHQPRKPPGYRGGPPSAGHLLAAYQAGRAETAR